VAKMPGSKPLTRNASKNSLRRNERREFHHRGSEIIQARMRG
jgi:hypothetical protein